ncbi:hypothetical protein LINGRAPRIM_LOCUS1329 [Linum grandiflorum]
MTCAQLRGAIFGLCLAWDPGISQG